MPPTTLAVWTNGTFGSLQLGIWPCPVQCAGWLFSSNPNDPYARILELQDAIQAYHDADISVVMDVVYNHVYHAETYAFEKIVPGYFYRYNEEETGQTEPSVAMMWPANAAWSATISNSLSANGLKSMDLMVPALTWWASSTPRPCRKSRLNSLAFIRTSTFTGKVGRWEPACLEQKLAHQYNAYQLNISFFNDDYRDTFKKILLNPYYIIEHQQHEKIQDLLSGSINGHFIDPQQSLNYLECHDNATLYDYLNLQNPNMSLSWPKRVASFGLQLVLISQGMVFIQSGQEFFRTKNGIDNTYNSPDAMSTN